MTCACGASACVVNGTTGLRCFEAEHRCRFANCSVADGSAASPEGACACGDSDCTHICGTAGDAVINTTVRWFNKTATHIPETLWLSNLPTILANATSPRVVLDRFAGDDVSVITVFPVACPYTFSEGTHVPSAKRTE